MNKLIDFKVNFFIRVLIIVDGMLKTSYMEMVIKNIVEFL